MTSGTRISLMLAVSDARAAAEWYSSALGADRLWSLGSVVGLEIEGAPFFLHEPTNTGFDSPAVLGTTTARWRCLRTTRTHSSLAPSRLVLTARRTKCEAILCRGRPPARRIPRPVRAHLAGR